MEEEKQNYTIILRHDTSTMWLVNDPILALGEYGVEDDTHKVKRGNGESKWSELTYEDFGLQYIVTYANLSGEITDNEALTNMFNSKLSISVFNDVNGSVLSNLKVNTTEVDGIAQVVKTTKNIQTGTTSTSNLTIQSEDNTIQGYWSMDKNGNRILNVIAVCSITDYQPSHRYYKDQLCYYNNKLYRAYRDIDADKTFNEGQWVLLASLHANDIEYDNLISGIDATNVKDALDELKRRDDRKLPKSTEPSSVYGTSDLGEQRMIPIDDLRKVDTVNRKQADLNKNVQLDASEINYSDANPELGSIRKVLDSKVDKNFAGEGAKIVRDININYNEDTGTLELVEDKVNPANGESGREVREIDIVSEKELSKNVETINSRIDTEVETLNTTIDNTKTELNERIDTEVETLNERIDTEVETLNGTIDTTKTELDGKIEALTGTVEANKTDIEQKLEEAKTELKHNIDINDGEINGRVTNEVATLNNRIDEEVATLNNTISSKETTINERIDTEVETLNERVDTEVANLNKTISDNKTDIEQKLNTSLDTKIDKDIADNILTDISASQQSQEPTLKIVRKNTSSKEAIVTHIHFKAVGNIKTSYSSDDHILIDSTEIDNALTEHNRRLDNAEGRLSAHDTSIAALEEHDVNHDRLLATHSEQIANHETRMASLETRADGFDTSIADLDTKIENETTNRKVVDAKLETDISRNALNIENNTQAIRDNADNIIELNNLLQENVTNLTQSKVDKTFAEVTNNMIVGNIDYSEPTGNELLKVNKTLVSPVDGSHNVTGFKILSSDNTVVAKPIMEEDELVGIDIATNLDTDVNYFVTSEILNTTIPSDNTVTLSSLTATDKQTVEVQDIISDSEGTWARVKSIDIEAGTCVAVTFHKHAQAVWGTVKGNIDDQQDLKSKFTNISADIKEVADNRIKTIAFAKYSGGRKYLEFLKDEPNTSYGIDIYGDTASGLSVDYTTQPLNSRHMYLKILLNIENTAFDPQESGLTSELLAPAIRELKTLNDSSVETLNATILEKETSLTELITQKETSLTANINNVNTTLSEQITNLDNTKLTKVDTANILYGTNETGVQTTFDITRFGNVDSVNGVEAVDKNITITGDDIAINSNTPDSINLVAQELGMKITNIINELQTQFLEYTPDTIFTIGTYVKTKFATFVRDDGIMLMAKVLKAFTADNTHETPYECFEYDIEQGNLKLIGIPEQIGNDGGDTPTPPHTGDILDNVVTLNNDLVAAVSHTTDGGTTGIKYIDITNNSSDSMTALSNTWEMTNNIVDSGSTITATNNDDTLVSTEIDKAYITSNFEIKTTSDYGQEVMTILNSVNGVEDEYTELGGTEQEISTILDEIAGTSN